MKDDHVVNIVGDKILYYDSSNSIISPDGKTIAFVHVGFKEQIVAEKVEKMVVRSVFILVIFFLISFFFPCIMCVIVSRIFFSKHTQGSTKKHIEET